MQQCSECLIRVCAIERKLENCATCEDYGCEKLLKVLEILDEPRKNLDLIRARL